MPTAPTSPRGPTAGTETADSLEFLARVLTHIPNKGQVTTRYYGWYANRPPPPMPPCRWWSRRSSRPPKGEVHDENAYALGGIAGHAGLFSTAADLSIFAQMMLNGGTYDGVHIISDSTVALFTRRTSGHRALGWDTADGDYGSGSYLTERAYGHTGFTGTSIWIDPDREMFVVLLTNRVNASRAQHPGKVIADVRADLSDAAVLAVLDGPTPTLAMPEAFRADREIGWNTQVKRVRCTATKSRHGRTVRSKRTRARVSCALASRRSKHSSVKSRSSSKRHSAASSSKLSSSRKSVKHSSSKSSAKSKRK